MSAITKFNHEHVVYIQLKYEDEKPGLHGTCIEPRMVRICYSTWNLVLFK